MRGIIAVHKVNKRRVTATLKDRAEVQLRLMSSRKTNKKSKHTLGTRVQLAKRLSSTFHLRKLRKKKKE